MLRRVVRNRMYVFILSIIFIAGGLWLPLRHVYSSSSEPPKNIVYQKTEVLYGAPFSWYTSGKITDTDTNKIISHYFHRDYKKGLYDLAILSAAALTIIAVFKLADMEMYANTRN